MKEKKRSNSKSREQKEKVTQNLSELLKAGWLHYVEEVGEDVAYGPHFTTEHFIRHIRTIIYETSETAEVINDMGEEGLKFYGYPWEI